MNGPSLASVGLCIIPVDSTPVLWWWLLPLQATLTGECSAPCPGWVCYCPWSLTAERRGWGCASLSWDHGSCVWLQLPPSPRVAKTRASRTQQENKNRCCMTWPRGRCGASDNTHWCTRGQPGCRNLAYCPRTALSSCCFSEVLSICVVASTPFCCHCTTQ